MNFHSNWDISNIMDGQRGIQSLLLPSTVKLQFHCSPFCEEILWNLRFRWNYKLKKIIHLMEKLVCNINDIKDHNNHKFIFIKDNAAIHKSREVQRFLNHNSWSILTICPYAPWLNPVESYISAIKAKIKKNFNIRKRGKN